MFCPACGLVYSHSLMHKANIPEEIVKRLDIKPGDQLEWQVLMQEGKTFARMRKVEKEAKIHG